MLATIASNQLPLEIPDDPFLGSRYRALYKLATGGMGDVYAVEHVELGRKFVAKLLRPELASVPHISDRLRLEAQTLGRLRHPNVVTIAGFDRNAQGLPFIVMELLKGRTLEQELAASGPMQPERAIGLAIQILSGLQALHRLGVVHRDIKPSNLFLHESVGSRRVLKILDFGVARVLPGACEQAPAPLAVPTRTGTLVGTPRFMSPEAAMGRPVDLRTDIHGVGLVLYLMLTGRGPFDDLSGDDNVVALAQSTISPRPPSYYTPNGLPKSLDQAVLQAIAKQPGDRFQTAEEFSSALAKVLDAISEPVRASHSFAQSDPGPEATRSKGIEPANPRSEWVNRTLLFLALMLLAALFVVGLALLVGRWR
jgi:eukaryotic-like serine/threonine-protein kinase